VVGPQGFVIAAYPVGGVDDEVDNVVGKKVHRRGGAVDGGLDRSPRSMSSRYQDRLQTRKLLPSLVRLP